jgi:hypothetical protein
VLWRECEVPLPIYNIQRVGFGPLAEVRSVDVYLQAVRTMAEALDRLALERYNDPGWLARLVEAASYEALLERLSNERGLYEVFSRVIGAVRRDDEPWRDFFTRTLDSPRGLVRERTAWYAGMKAIAAWVNEAQDGLDVIRQRLSELAQRFTGRNPWAELEANYGKTAVSRIGMCLAFLENPRVEDAERIIAAVKPGSEETFSRRALVPWLECLCSIAERATDEGLIQKLEIA